MLNTYKETSEWKLLNKIWKTLSQDQQNLLNNEFMLLSEFIKKHTDFINKDITSDEYGYLNGLSDDSKNFILEMKKLGYPNLYHSMMAVIENNRNLKTSDELLNWYTQKYQTKRTEVIKHRTELKELSELCIKRAKLKKWI